MKGHRTEANRFTCSRCGETSADMPSWLAHRDTHFSDPRPLPTNAVTIKVQTPPEWADVVADAVMDGLLRLPMVRNAGMSGVLSTGELVAWFLPVDTEAGNG